VGVKVSLGLRLGLRCAQLVRVSLGLRLRLRLRLTFTRA